MKASYFAQRGKNWYSVHEAVPHVYQIEDGEFGIAHKCRVVLDFIADPITADCIAFAATLRGKL